MNNRRRFYEAPLAEIFNFSIITTGISLPDKPIVGGDESDGGDGGNTSSLDTPIDIF